MKIAFPLFVFLIISGCNSSKKEKGTNLQIQPDTLVAQEKTWDQEEFHEEPKNDTVIVEKDTISVQLDSIAIIDKTTQNTSETTKTTEIVKKEITEKTVKKIRPNHTLWDVLTKKNVSSSGKVNYKAFKKEITKVEKYLEHLKNTPPKKGWSKNEKLSYWFNLYNAATIHLIASAYPVKSIKDIHNGKPWDKKFIKSGNKLYSLNQIENSIVRPYFAEPRLHVAFNCAAVSCPKLMKGAFFPAQLNAQLSRLSKNWINDNSKNKISKNNVKISKIFQWYKEDFKTGVIPFINQYATTKANTSAKIQYLEYNWNLND